MALSRSSTHQYGNVRFEKYDSTILRIDSIMENNFD